MRLEGGCSGPSWLMTCCVPQLIRNDDSSNAPLVVQQQVSVGGLRSASGSGRPTGLVSTLEGIANLGRNDCEFSKKKKKNNKKRLKNLYDLDVSKCESAVVVLRLRFNVRGELKFKLWR